MGFGKLSPNTRPMNPMNLNMPSSKTVAMDSHYNHSMPSDITVGLSICWAPGSLLVHPICLVKSLGRALETMKLCCHHFGVLNPIVIYNMSPLKLVYQELQKEIYILCTLVETHIKQPLKCIRCHSGHTAISIILI